MTVATSAWLVGDDIVVDVRPVAARNPRAGHIATLALAMVTRPPGTPS